MKNSIENIDLVVPLDKKTRVEIRKKVDDYFNGNEIIPPVSAQQLYHYASILISENYWDKELLGFTMVCCGNASWRKTIGAIPFNRRVLLLPQCLKNSKICKAPVDEFGLLCENCANCTIPDITEKAEELGYVVLVTEGTTVTAKLIESGKIDAVIGVGCMEVLQKINNSVLKYSIPGIGIPLLTNGCKDTKADYDWILEEIKFIESNSRFNLLNTNIIKSNIQHIFNYKTLQKLFVAGDDETTDIMIKSILLGGNRYRAFLTALTYEAFCNTSNNDAVSKLTLSIECFHKASLIHDDIEDNDFTRYGKDTIHAEYGIPVAINTGDLLIGQGYRLVAESGLNPETIVKCFQLLSDGHKTLSIGQGNELLSILRDKILSINELIKIFEQKTATAFKVSILLGAIAGGADDQAIAILNNFSRNIGIAYQILDDIRDFKSHHGDIEKRKISIFISLLSTKLALEEQKILENSLRIHDFTEVYKLIERFDIKNESTGLLKEYIQKAKSDLENLTVPGLKIALNRILGEMFSEYL